ncbi:MAG: DUF11 domain-containing protein [Phaeodactylibacter sp.]|nr:DUF11 domain-containing protein [Phaeodactylibacter sp.]MCB9048019.1 DUF11 domain-containing protein [Lewinellaceae bacterium]
MKRKGLLTIVFTLAIAISATPQGWIKGLGNQDATNGNGVVQTADGGFAVTGQWAGANPHIWRTDADGNTLWHTVFPGPEYGHGNDIALTSDGGFVLTGQHQPNFDENPTLLLAKTDAAGNILWQREFFEDYPNVTDSIEYNIGKQVLETPDGGLLAVGETSGNWYNNIFIVRTDADGNELWRRVYGEDILINIVTELMPLPTGGYAIAGYSMEPNPLIFPYPSNLFLLQIDEQGNELDIKYHPLASAEQVKGATRAADGSFYLTVSPASFSPGALSRIIKLDAGGNILWEKSSPVDDHLLSIQATPQGELAVTGQQSRGPNDFEYLITLVKLDAEAENVAWRREIPYGLDNYANALINTADGGYGISGRVQYSSTWPYGQNALLIKANSEGYVYTCSLEGRVFLDENQDCADNGELPLEGWLITATKAGESLYATSGPDGSYGMTLDTGAYTVTVTGPSVYWSSCQASYTATLPAPFSNEVLDIPAQADVSCPLMEVDISTSFLRRCFSSTYTVQYCNNGTTPTLDASVEVTLDPFLSYNNSSIPFSQQDGQTYTFSLGMVDPNQCGSFYINVDVSCDAELGQTHCTEARIFPDSTCLDTLWPGPVLLVSGQCSGDSVNFRIENAGAAMDMQQHYIVTEDNIMLMEAPFQLGAGGVRQVSIPIAGNSTYRLEAEQAPGFPALLGSPYASAVLEGCNGVNPGFVTIFPNNDGGPFTDIDCRENVGSYDPNDKQVFPRGYGEENFVRPGTELEYLIRFQNTGTDTAFTVVIRDTLSALLDVKSIRPGAASHDYSYRIYGGGILEFRFDDILLPDSTTNLEASQGFVKFFARHYPDAELGSTILNQAGIYFDFNEPVITNTTLTTLGENFIVSDIREEGLPEGVRIEAYPNPFREECTIEVKGMEVGEGMFLLYDGQGRQVRQEAFRGPRLDFRRQGLPGGLYFFTILADGRPVGVGKAVIGR